MHLSIRNKLILLLFSVVTVVCLVISFYAVQTTIAGALTAKAESDNQTAQKIIADNYPGDWNIRDGVLYKGKTKINDNTELVDTIARLTDDTVTVFQGDTRVTTNVKDKSGKRAVGTQAAQNVVDTVLNKGENYTGAANVVGQTFQTAYTPIKDASGQIIGMFYVGVSKVLADKLQNQFITTFIVVVLLVLLASLLIVWFMAKRITRPIEDIIKYTGEIAKGNLVATEVKINTKDEIGQLGLAFNNMVTNLRSLIRQVSESAEQVSAASQELMASSEQHTQSSDQVASSIASVANDTDKQLTAVNKIASALEQISGSIQHVAASSSNVGNLTDETTVATGKGQKSINKAIQQIDNIGKRADKVQAATSKLVASSKQIGEIIKVITGIADQTKLLAFNTSIEAARAGEQGRGFAIVAQEVRNLSEQSQEAANQITQLISESLVDIENTVTATDAAVRDVKLGIEVVNAAGSAFATIASSITRVSSQIQEISSSVQHMVNNSGLVVVSMHEIEKFSRDTAGKAQTVSAATEEQTVSMEQIASTSQGLARMAEEMQEGVRKFKV